MECLGNVARDFTAARDLGLGRNMGLHVRQGLGSRNANIVARKDGGAGVTESSDNRPTAGWNHPIGRVSWRV